MAFQRSNNVSIAPHHNTLPPNPEKILLPHPIQEVTGPLPILGQAEAIVTAIMQNSCVIIQAETGSGKTTQTPLLAMRAGIEKSIVCLPRRFAVTSVSDYMARSMGEKVGNTIGFAHAFDSSTSENTRICLQTAGYQLRRMWAGQDQDVGILFLDEFHERQPESDILFAEAYRQQKAGRNLKIVVMSATIDADAISQYLGGAPIIRVPGRGFPIERLTPTQSMLDETNSVSQSKLNSINFYFGLAPILADKKEILRLNPGRRVLPLHSSLSQADQDRVHFPKSVPTTILSTNIAEASVTIADLDMVRDSGKVRRKVDIDGVTHLLIDDVSKAEAEQRMGRVGREKPGWASYHGKNLETLKPFPTPAIVCTSLHQYILSMACRGLDYRAVRLLSMPSEHSFKEGENKLRDLGLFSADREPTDLGRVVEQIPVSSECGIMLAHAKMMDLACPGTLRRMIKIVSIFESEGVINYGTDSWRSHIEGNTQSDLFVHLALYEAGKAMTTTEKKSAQQQRREAGILESHFHDAAKKEIKLMHDFKINEGERPSGPPSKKQYTALQQCICRGMADSVYIKSVDQLYQGRGGARSLSNDSVVNSERRVVGMPMNIDVELSNEAIKNLPLLFYGTVFDGTRIPKDLQRHLHIIAPERKDKGPRESAETHRNRQQGKHTHGHRTSGQRR